MESSSDQSELHKHLPKKSRKAGCDQDSKAKPTDNKKERGGKRGSPPIDRDSEESVVNQPAQVRDNWRGPEIVKLFPSLRNDPLFFKAQELIPRDSLSLILLKTFFADHSDFDVLSLIKECSIYDKKYRDEATIGELLPSLRDEPDLLTKAKYLCRDEPLLLDLLKKISDDNPGFLPLEVIRKCQSSRDRAELSRGEAERSRRNPDGRASEKVMILGLAKAREIVWELMNRSDTVQLITLGKFDIGPWNTRIYSCFSGLAGSFSSTAYAETRRVMLDMLHNSVALLEKVCQPDSEMIEHINRRCRPPMVLPYDMSDRIDSCEMCGAELRGDYMYRSEVPSNMLDDWYEKMVRHRVSCGAHRGSGYVDIVYDIEKAFLCWRCSYPFRKHKYRVPLLRKARECYRRVARILSLYLSAVDTPLDDDGWLKGFMGQMLTLCGVRCFSDDFSDTEIRKAEKYRRALGGFGMSYDLDSRRLSITRPRRTGVRSLSITVRITEGREVIVEEEEFPHMMTEEDAFQLAGYPPVWDSYM